jgi:hypothetical protein
MKILSNPGPHLRGKLNYLKKKNIFIWKVLCFLIFKCPSHQPISVANLGWSVNNLKRSKKIMSRESVFVPCLFWRGSTARQLPPPPRCASGTIDQPVAERPPPNKTQQLGDTDIHTPGGILTYNSGDRAAADPCPRQRPVGTILCSLHSADPCPRQRPVGTILCSLHSL